MGTQVDNKATKSEATEYFLGIGHEKGDLKQLLEAMHDVKLKLLDAQGKVKGRISTPRAIEILGLKEYLSGISRSAFHASAVRMSATGECGVEFDLRDWWRNA